MAGEVLRIGIAGLGTVGGGLIRFLRDDPAFAPGGRRVEITGVTARSRSRPRSVDVSELPWFDDPVALARAETTDVFVELIGGSDGPAKAAVTAALQAGKPVVTANKALLAEHGLELAALAESRGAPLLYEAAVMGGTPAVKMLREGLVGDDVDSVSGILNGTCNFILSEMEAKGLPFATVLAEAQRLGYAEADPTMDVGGYDAAHKITLLAALAFGGAPDYAAAEIEGVESVAPLDIRMARDLGYRIKLIASAERVDGAVSVRVQPSLVPLGHPLAQAGGALNALFIEGRRIGRIYLQGPGAGAGPTAAAVAADIADVLAGGTRPVFRQRAERLSTLPSLSAENRTEKAYIRLIVRDQPGVIAAVTEALGEAQVSIDSFLQKPVEDHDGVPIVLTTQDAPESRLQDVVKRIAALPFLLEAPRRFRLAPI
jgi:homoserine dehydrogenase